MKSWGFPSGKSAGKPLPVPVSVCWLNHQQEAGTRVPFPCSSDGSTLWSIPSASEGKRMKFRALFFLKTCRGAAEHGSTGFCTIMVCFQSNKGLIRLYSSEGVSTFTELCLKQKSLATTPIKELLQSFHCCDLSLLMPV